AATLAAAGSKDDGDIDASAKYDDGDEVVAAPDSANYVTSPTAITATSEAATSEAAASAMLFQQARGQGAQTPARTAVRTARASARNMNTTNNNVSEPRNEPPSIKNMRHSRLDFANCRNKRRSLTSWIARTV
ncbi:hypothetical protein BGZ47_008317, partial [Haplosporangium gracile]